MIEIRTDLPAEIVPLSWLIGEWEGVGVLSYNRAVDPDARTSEGDVAVETGADALPSQDAEFKQHVSFRYAGDSALEYTATTWQLPNAVLSNSVSSNTASSHTEPSHTEAPTQEPPEEQLLSSETGYWRLALPRTDADVGPGLILPTESHVPLTAAEIEQYRLPEGGFPIQVALSHPDGVSELYLGKIDGPRIDIATDAVIAPATERPYRASTRMFGLVGGKLMWAWDIAALGLSLRSHASAVLDRVTDDSTADDTSSGRAASATTPEA